MAGASSLSRVLHQSRASAQYAPCDPWGSLRLIHTMMKLAFVSPSIPLSSLQLEPHWKPRVGEATSWPGAQPWSKPLPFMKPCLVLGTRKAPYHVTHKMPQGIPKGCRRYQGR